MLPTGKDFPAVLMVDSISTDQGNQIQHWIEASVPAMLNVLHKNKDKEKPDSSFW
ncbi:MAG: hypothetical protein CM1200mP30_32690 [Pseudomonadota bacterium]|nr:MAG: hypothetical protein CM1200mP30_32690 [Pseudomonadota bacterium]